MYTLRQYQSDCIDEAVKWMKCNTLGAVCELSGGAGKSIIIAEVAKRMHELSGKSILCLVPNAELLVQNCQKLEAIGAKFSIYSASISKSMRHPIIVATEGSWKAVAKKHGAKFSTVLVDEGDRTTATLTKIMNDMRGGNPLLRLCAFTGTAFRMKTGYIYEIDLNNKAVLQTVEPFYKKLIYRLTCNELIDMGYLTPVAIGAPCKSYNTSSLKLSGDGFTNQSLKDTFESDNTLTQRIVHDIVEKTQDRKGVMIFAATLDHAREIIKYLPQDDYLFVHGEMGKAERKEAVELFKSQKKKYIVNRDILTIGFDAPHCDAIALLRATSSNRLFAQIVWRGVRLYEGKTDALLLDYANNIENLFDGSTDIFTPNIKVYGVNVGVDITVTCEQCGTQQEHTKRKEYDTSDIYGYVTDLHGHRLDPPIPSHHGRRCLGVVRLGNNNFERCSYYWTYKECPECDHKNDIAARKCGDCGVLLVNPEDKLNEKAIFLPTDIRCDPLLNYTATESISKAGNPILRVEFVTPNRVFTVYYQTQSNQAWLNSQYEKFLQVTENLTVKPQSIEYKKDGDFWKVLSFNKPTDNEVLKDAVSKLA